MTSFRNILVGVDLSRCECLDSGSLGPVADSALNQARWLALRSKGRITYCAALNKQRFPWRLIEPIRYAKLLRSVQESAGRVLQELVEDDRTRGIDSRTVLAHGKGWVELLQQVQRDQHDLLIVGGRHPTGLRRALFGSTSRHLLRQCPCPVWVAQSGAAAPPQRILVATDLGPASENALHFGVALARLAEGSGLHILHVVDYPLDHLWSTGLSDDWTDAYRRMVRSEATAVIRSHLERAGATGQDQPQIHFIDEAGVPDEAILQFIHDHAIDLLILGTVGRSGLSGILIGNTADRLLPEVWCSVLAVKPPDLPAPPLNE
jgi:universal stress protein E